MSFASTIIEKLEGAISKDGKNYNSGTPGIANAAIANACTEYLIANTTVMVSYSGTLIAPPHSPVVSAGGMKITGTVPPPSGTTFDAWFNSLCLGIRSGLLVLSGSGITAVPSCLFWLGTASSPSLSGPGKNNAQTNTWNNICQSIVTWLTGGSWISSFPASMPGSMGVATITKVIIV